MGLQSEQAVYSFDNYKSDKSAPYQLELNISTNKEDLHRYFINGAIIGQSVNVARDYSNMPPNILTPNYFFEQVTQHFDETSVKVDIKDGKQLLDEGSDLFMLLVKGRRILQL